MTITAAADGSALGNPGPNGWAWYIDDANWAAGGSPHGTNNQGELQAVLELLQSTADAEENLVILCDSKYVIDSITKWMPGWKRRGWRKADGAPVLNRDLMEALDAEMSGRDVRFEWVKGHAGHPLNEAADERANAAATAYKQKQEPRRGPGFTKTSVAPAAPVASAASVIVTAPVTPAAEASVNPAASHPASAASVASTASVASAAVTAPTVSAAASVNPGASVSATAPTVSAAAVTPAAPVTSTASHPAPAVAAAVVAAPAVAPQLWAEASDLLEALDAGPTVEAIDLRLRLSAEEHARLRDRADAQGISLEEALRRLI